MSNEEIEDCLYWMLDTSDDKYTRATGRTTILKNVYCRLLKNNPGKEFIIRDHFPKYVADKKLAEYIVKELTSENKNYQVSIRENILSLYIDE